MSAEYLKLILDIVILAGLGGFMYYALRLSKALNAFRSYRNEFDHVMQRLNQHVEDAQTAIKSLKDTSQESGNALHKKVKDAQFLLDELQLVTEAGNNLAERLETLAEKNSLAAQGIEEPMDFARNNNVSPIQKRQSKRSKPGDDDFIIQDREFEDDIAQEDEALNELTSEAEKELYQALKQTGHKG